MVLQLRLLQHLWEWLPQMWVGGCQAHPCLLVLKRQRPPGLPLVQLESLSHGAPSPLRAAAYSKLGNYAGAVRDCERAIGIDPKYSKAYGRMGYVGPSTALGTGRGGAADLGGETLSRRKKGTCPSGGLPSIRVWRAPPAPLLSCKAFLSGFQGGASLGSVGLFMEWHKSNPCANAAV